MIAALPPNEIERLQALKRYNILDTPIDPAFDDITRIASYICETPISIVSFVDKERQWFKSTIGIDDIRETPRDISFCSHSILESEWMIIPDTLEDSRFSDNPIVTDAPKIRFYAGAVLTTSDGYPLGTVCVLDYKPRQLSDAQRKILGSLARQSIALLELRRSLVNSQRLNDYRSRLIAVAGHDLKQPVQVAMLLTEKVAKSLSKESDLQASAMLKQSLSDLGTELTTLATASRLGQDHDMPQWQDFAIGPLLEKVANTWRHHAQAKNLELRVMPSTSLVHSDPGMLATVLGNLIGNAIKYTETGRILIGCQHGDDHILLKVLDTGLGIPSGKLDHIFHAFHQLDENKDGLGLGLSIVKQTAELLEHRLGVTSTLGKGSCFSIAVPLAKTASKQQAA